jgi:tetratricopeptide (TPR) repeat protein
MLTDAYYWRGLARGHIGDNQGAIEDSTQVLKLDSSNANAYLNRGSAQLQMGNKEGAIIDFNQALKINANFSRAYYNRGLANVQLGKEQDALADFQKAALLAQQQKEQVTYEAAQRQIQKLQQ